MRKIVKIATVLAILTIFLVSTIYFDVSYCSQEVYAFKGAMLKYSVIGPENWTETYIVKEVVDDTMVYVKEIHYFNGTWMNRTFKENVEQPVNFPAVPQSNIGKKNVLLLNRTFQLVEKTRIILNNHIYTAFEYAYGEIGVVIDLFIDSQTGIILNGTKVFHGYNWHFQLVDTNIKPKNCSIIYIIIGVELSATMVAGWSIYKTSKILKK